MDLSLMAKAGNGNPVGISPAPPRRATDHIDPSVVFGGGGEMGALMRSIDWSKTPLGPVSGWSETLRATVGLLLCNRFPMLLWWGPEFVQIYNDAYRPIAGAKHPRSLGQRGSECWAEIWHIIGPMVDAPFRGGPATVSDDLDLLIHRKGFLEECHFNVAYSSVPDKAAPGGRGGVLATVAETTAQVYGERQLHTLRELGARTVGAHTPEKACLAAAATLERNPRDVPFALFYLFDDACQSARLAGASGFGTSTHAAAPATLRRGNVGARGWSLDPSLFENRVLLVDDLDVRFGALPSGAWAATPRAALAIPLASPDRPQPYGVLFAGLSPHRELDDGYSSFFELVAAQLVAAIRNARAYQEEKKRAEALAEIDRAKTAFFSNVSHEFRTPLTLMIGPTEDLLSESHGPISHRQREQLELLHRSELRLHKLVNALLEFSRIEANRIQATYEPVDLSALTRDLASIFRSAIERAGLELVLDLRDLDEPVFVDREMWEKIVLNLLSNALKFTFEGRIVVSLVPEGQAVVFSVKDSGVGISESELPRVFERFHRIEGTRARTQEGSGIGLALVSELVKLHGGSIAVESRVDHGTTFTITLPKGSAHLPEERIAAQTDTRAPTVGAAAFVEEALRWLPSESKPEELAPARVFPSVPGADVAARILVADDNADMRDYVSRLLATHWSVEAAEDGAKALAMARARPPDLVLTDVMMPGLDGFALLRELRQDERTRAVPVVMLSARAGEEASVEGLQAGADDYLTKPFSARELLARVGAQLTRSKLLSAISRQAALLDLSTDAVFAWDLEGGIVYWNAAASTLYGFSRDEAIGATSRVLLRTVASSGEDFLTALRRMGAWQGELTQLSKSGDPIIVESYMRVVKEAGRSLVLAVNRDIRERKQIEREREARLAEAEQALRFSEMFVGMLGHDLRSPLTAIMVAAQRLAANVPSSPLESAALRIVSSSQRMARMIDQLLDFTRIRLGAGLPCDPIDMDMKEVIERTTDELRAGTGRSIVVVVEGDGHGSWDPDRLAQMFSNLVGNACQHGTSSLPVTVRLDGRAMQAVTVSVSNGGTIPPELLPVLFEPLHGGRKGEKSSGLGLGLYITKQIAAAHGGEIRVASSEDSGTLFTVELPRRATGTARAWSRSPSSWS